MSVFLHGLLIFAIFSPWLRKYYALSDDPSDLPGLGGGGGRSGEQYIALAALRPATRAAPPAVETPKPVVQPPTEVPQEIPPPAPEPDTIPKTASIAPTDSAGAAGASGTTGTGGGTGGGVGSGQGPGTGSGSGPGTGGGYKGRAPELRGFPIPPTEGTPKALRGRELVVRCFVGIDGKVERYETFPEVNDGGFRRKLDDIVTGYRFKPAQDSTGRIVPGIATVTLTLANR